MAKQFTEWAREVLTEARGEAVRRGSEHVVTEHLMLVLCRDPESAASQTLAGLGVDVTGLVDRLDQQTKTGNAVVDADEIVFAPQAKKVIERAIYESGQLGHDHIGTEHLLLGLLEEGGEPLAGLFQDHGVDAARVRAEIERPSEPDPPPASAGEGFALTPPVREALEAALAGAAAEARAALGEGALDRAAWWREKERGILELLGETRHGQSK